MKLIVFGIVLISLSQYSFAQEENTIVLTDTDFEDEDGELPNMNLLRASKDAYLTKAAFEFSQVFYSVRGYDSKEGKVYLNGILMNQLYNGRPEWNHWGGLNDVTRNQEFVNGLNYSANTFGGLLGTTQIYSRASNQRKGKRVSGSFSNRTYSGRLMTTFNSGKSNSDLSYSISASRRWGSEGFIDGTLYDAYSVFGGLEYQLSEKQSINFTGIYVSNRRGRSAAITDEVYDLTGRKYNPYWGNQEGEIRNSRERKIKSPLFIVDYTFSSDQLELNAAFAYHKSTTKRSRLGYYNAPNPDPTYYRNLPSYYINSTSPNYENAQLAREGFLENPQLNWINLYGANTLSDLSGKSTYILYDDVNEDTQWSGSITGDFKLNNKLNLNFGGYFQNLKSKNFAQIDDLLGGEFHEDLDTFSNTKNDIHGELNKKEGDTFSYNYAITALLFQPFVQLLYQHKKLKVFTSVQYQNTRYQREGLYQNERFLNSSLGESEQLSFGGLSYKTGITYTVSPRHFIKVHLGYLNNPPTIQNSFINPREHNLLSVDDQLETTFSFDASYIARLPKFKGHITGFYTRTQNETDINFFYVDSGLGSDYVQEVTSGIDKTQQGMELSLEYELSSSVKLIGAAGVGSYRYANNPNVTINFDTSNNEEPIDISGTLDLGKATLKNYRLANGPQQAYAIAIEYRSPKYWWITASTNYFTDRYINISNIRRTESFVIDPDTGVVFEGVTQERLLHILEQGQLDALYLMNITGGKSWRVDNKYVSAFVSVNNLFDTSFKTGGYEQSRNGNYKQLYEDNLRGMPSFGNKYWWGFGRSCFINLAISF